MRETRYYENFTDDFEETANQNYVLPNDYRWIKTDFGSRFLSAIIYALAVFFGFFYCKFGLRLKKIHGRKKLKKFNGKYFLYGNHTQPVGDVFLPAMSAFPKRIYTVVGTANYGIPVIGKILPYLGALPVKETLSGLKNLGNAISTRISQGHPVVIYPEAHVWEYYTEIRPFPLTSFKFPTAENTPVFSSTVVYQKTKISKRPKAEIYIDGPFYGEGETTKERAENLKNKVFDKMTERSKLSNYEYIQYIKK